MRLRNSLIGLVVLIGGCGGGAGTPAGISRNLAVCATRAHDLGTAALMYTNDNDGMTPPAETWMDSVHPYVQSETVFHCPSLTLAPQYGYAFNSLTGITALSTIPIAETKLVYESSNLTRNAHDDVTSLLSHSRHDGKVLVIMADGNATQIAGQ